MKVTDLVRQRENFLVLMSNYNQVLEAQAIQLNSAGLATERYQIYLESIEGKANTLKATIESVWKKTIDEDVIKFFLDLSIETANFVDELGGLIPVLEALIGLVIALNSQNLINFFTSSTIGANALTNALIDLNAIMSVMSMSASGKGLLGGLKAMATTFVANVSPAVALTAAIIALTAVVITYQQTVKKQQDLGLENTTNAWSNAFKNLGEEIKTTEQVMKEYKNMVDSVNDAHEKGGWIANLFVDKQKILDQGLKEVITTLKDTTSNYNDYTVAVERAAKLAGYTIDENGRFIKSMGLTQQAIIKTADDFGVLTDAELGLFNASKAELDTWVTAWKRANGQIYDTTEELSQAFDDLQYILDDSFGKAFDSYHEKQEQSAIQAAELREEIRLLSEQPTLSDEQLTQLGDLQYELYNVEQDILKTAEAYEKSLQASIISTFIQRVSLSELGVDAKNAAYNMAADMMNAWGLMGSETVRVMGAMDLAMIELQKGNDELARKHIENAFKMGNSWAAISGNYYVNFIVTENRVVSPGTGGNPLLDGMYGIDDVKGMPFNPPPTNAPFSGFSGGGLSSGGGGSGGGSSSSPKEEIKTLKDLHNLVISLIKAEKNAIKDSLKEQLDAYEEIIDAKKEILKAEQESIEYQEELEDKTKGIAKIQSEMAILALDTSAESKARQLELAEELADAQKDLEQTQRDRSYDLQEEALDKEYDLYKENIDLQIAAIDEYLDKTGQIAQDALNIIGEQAPNLYQSLIDWNEEYGSGIKTDVIEAWNEAYDALLKYGNLADALYGGVSPTVSTETLPTHHSGLSSGAVGGVRTLPGEVLSKLLVGEEVMNNNDILKTLKMIPSVANIINRSQGSGGGLNIENLITIQGDVIEKTIPKIKDIARDVIKEINSTLVRQGSVRDVASIYG